MSKVDTTFDFANALVLEWGQDAVFVQKGTPTYNIDTGETAETETRIDVKIVITKLDITELGGLYQENDVKIVIDPVQLNYDYVTTADYFEVPTAGTTQIMKIITPTTYRGDNPVGYVIIARPQ